MNILTGYLSATSGQVTVAGHPLPEEADAAKACVGYLPAVSYTHLDVYKRQV